jgi:hypothetical protein
VRGCLFVLIAAAIVISAAAWFGSPALAGAVVRASLEGSGLRAATLTTEATSDPPPKLLLGRADRLTIDGSDVDFRTFHAARLVLELSDVDLLGRTAGTIDGRVEGAELKTTDGVPTTAEVTIAGPARAAGARIDVDGATVSRVVTAAFARQIGVPVTGVELAEPDTIRIPTGAGTLEGRLVIDASGAIALSTRLGQASLLSLDPAFPLRLTAVRVVAGDLRIDGVLDAEALVGG